jgi:alkanesulfonate monooxygenase SsuD/methylene tetrahydromethanopterin reductase-like flavin-dependent oxidoreductase (luciferase family)
MSIKRGVAAPCFAEDPMALVDLAVEAEQAGFDGFFLWDHMTWADDGLGPSIVDPWAVLSVIAARTERIIVGPLITPVSRRRPWVLARQTVTLDLLASGRTVFGVGLGAPAHGDFGIFGEETGNRARAGMLDEGLDLMARLWTGDVVDFRGEYFQVEPVRFTPTPFNGTRIPVWVGGVLPSTAGMRRAARWDGAVPIRYEAGGLARPSARDIALVRDLTIEQRGNVDGFDLVVWAEVAQDPDAVAAELPAYEEAGTTWWIETARPGRDDNWHAGLRSRISAGPAGRRGMA